MAYYLKAIAGLQLPAKKTFDMKVPGAYQNRACTFHTNPLSQTSPFFKHTAGVLDSQVFFGVPNQNIADYLMSHTTDHSYQGHTAI